jgi:hypothetical protein
MNSWLLYLLISQLGFSFCFAPNLLISMNHPLVIIIIIIIISFALEGCRYLRHTAADFFGTPLEVRTR